ncbi:hypothetical protein Acr_16g0000320 [Actinidia rufa]|uniref:Uncharacterized protein n=1 Tax=Actinidia rufa TaxID=165716 RepID=A0A7J0FZQ8_9ERIC|nr:hypothetical protein Acr_16g0000320 [Actinidia rufa]
MNSQEEEIKYLAHDVNEPGHYLIKGELIHLLIIGGEVHLDQIFFYRNSPSHHRGLRTQNLARNRLGQAAFSRNKWPHRAFARPLLVLAFFAYNSGATCFPLDPSSKALFLDGNSESSSWGHFSEITTPLVDEVAAFSAIVLAS